MGVQRECKIRFFVFNRCDFGIICYYSIIFNILIDIGIEIREIELVFYGYIVNNRKNQDVSLDIFVLEFVCSFYFGVWYIYLMVLSWNLRGRIKNFFLNFECFRNEGLYFEGFRMLGCQGFYYLGFLI